MAEDNNLEKKVLHVFTRPSLASKKYHIFESTGGISMCGKWMLLAPNPNYCSPVEGAALRFDSKQDCKQCWKKAGLSVPTEEKTQ